MRGWQAWVAFAWIAVTDLQTTDVEQRWNVKLMNMIRRGCTG